MMIWEELIRTALLGTERTALADSVLEALRAEGIAPNSDAAQQLLEGLSIIHSGQKGGFELKEFKGEIPKPIQNIEDQVCSPHSAYHLNLILYGDYKDALPEFLKLLQRSQQVLPAEHLPPLFDASLSNGALWQTLKPVLGQRGQWLLGLQSGWRKLYANPNREDWEKQDLPFDIRLSILRYIRQQEPDQAISLLEADWKTYEPKQKVGLLKELAEGLATTDEVFLESCLQDKRKEVRDQAAQLLMLLPDSALQGRLFEFAQQYLHRNSRYGYFELELPDALDPILAQNGIQKRVSTSFSGGQKAGWVYQLLRVIPPTKWEEHFGLAPAEVLKAFGQSNWKRMGLQAMAEASLKHNLLDWLEAIVRYWWKQQDADQWNSVLGKRVMLALSEESFNAIVQSYMESQGPLLNEQDFVTQLVCQGGHAWNKKVSIQILEGFRNWLAQAGKYDWNILQYKRVLRVAAYQADPEVFERFRTGWNQFSPVFGRWESDINQLLSTLAFRRKVREGFGGKG